MQKGFGLGAREFGFDDDAHDFDLFNVGGQVIDRDDPAFAFEACGERAQSQRRGIGSQTNRDDGHLLRVADHFEAGLRGE